MKFSRYECDECRMSCYVDEEEQGAKATWNCPNCETGLAFYKDGLITDEAHYDE